MVVLTAAAPSSVPGSVQAPREQWPPVPRGLSHVPTTYWPCTSSHLLPHTVRSFLLRTASAIRITEPYVLTDAPKINFFSAPYHCEIVHLTVMAGKFHFSSHSGQPVHQTMTCKDSSLTQREKKIRDYTQSKKSFLLVF